MRIEEKIARLLIRRKKTLAVAESCSGGLLCDRLTNVQGSSKFLKFGLIVYTNESKIKFLKISPRLIAKHGEVSEPIALKMASQARKIFHTDLGLSITGIAGPSGGSKTKPIGLVFIALSTPNEEICLQCHFKGNRLQVKSQAAEQALNLLLKFLL